MLIVEILAAEAEPDHAHTVLRVIWKVGLWVILLGILARFIKEPKSPQKTAITALFGLIVLGGAILVWSVIKPGLDSQAEAKPDREQETIVPMPPRRAKAVFNVGRDATVSVPRGWAHLDWDLPDLALAIGDSDRGEYATIHQVPRRGERSFVRFEAEVFERVKRDFVSGASAAEAHRGTVSGRPAVSRSLSGHCRLPGQVGTPMAARFTCVDGVRHDYYIMQWRSAGWDERTAREFNNLLGSFTETGASPSGPPPNPDPQPVSSSAR